MNETKYKLTVSKEEAHRLLIEYIRANNLRNMNERHKVIDLMSTKFMSVSEIYKKIDKVSKATIYNFFNKFGLAGIFQSNIVDIEGIHNEYSKLGIDNNIEVYKQQVDFKQLRESFFNEHVSRKTTDGIPVVCTHPHNLFEWFKNEINEYIK